MRSPARGALRWVRSAALAVATVGLAATAHVLGGGAVPSAGALGTLTLLTALGCVVTTARRRGTIAILAAMSVLQVMLHEGFMLLGPMPMGPPTTGCFGAGGSAGTGFPEHLLLHDPGSLASLCVPAPAAADAGSGSWSMLLAHAAATVVLAAALAGGERALWALGHLVLPTMPEQAPVLSSPRHRIPSDAAVVPNEWTSVRGLLRRGPPAARTTAA